MPAARAPSLLLLIPAYNEEHRLPPVLQAVQAEVGQVRRFRMTKDPEDSAHGTPAVLLAAAYIVGRGRLVIGEDGPPFVRVRRARRV